MSSSREHDRSEAAWFHDATHRVKAARDRGDQAEVDRLRNYVRREGGDHLGDLLDQLLTAVDELQTATVEGRPTRRRSLGAAGNLICDFCAGEPVAYYPFTEFTIVGAGSEWSSGDRWYVCHRCHELFEAGNWQALRDWVGPTAANLAVRVLWNGFRMNRTGEAVFFTPGTNPE